MAITIEEYYKEVTATVKQHNFIVGDIKVDIDFMKKHNINMIRNYDGELCRWWISVDNNGYHEQGDIKRTIYLRNDEMFEKFITELNNL